MKDFREAMEQTEAALKCKDSAQITLRGGSTVVNNTQAERAVNSSLDDGQVTADTTMADESQISDETGELNEEEDMIADISAIAASDSECVCPGCRKVKFAPYIHYLEEQSSSNQAPPAKKKVLKEVTFNQEIASLVDREFVQLCQGVRLCLTLERANVNRCLEILKQLKELQLNCALLVRNPDCVDTIRCVQHYIGNFKSWHLTPEQEAEFKAGAENIRNEASMIFSNFKNIANDCFIMIEEDDKPQDNTPEVVNVEDVEENDNFS
uniref:LEDGF domain-containing protein n=1 Tax=Glossina brevipalpis TaxID=37001 RepID=A0A1A9WEB7_9MUSC